MSRILVPYFINSHQAFAFASCPRATWVEMDTESVRRRLAALPITDGTLNDRDKPGMQFTANTGFSAVAVPVNGLIAIVDQTVPPDLQRDLHVQERTRGRSSYKGFRQAQKDGGIVLNPMRAVKARMEDKAILSLDRLIAIDTIGGAEDSIATEVIACGNQPAYEIPYTPYPVQKSAMALPYAVAQIGYRLYEGNAKSLFQTDMPPLQLFLDHLDKVQQSGALINQARADLHEGVYNLMLDIGEANETISFIYDVLRQIVRLALIAISKERKKKAAVQLMRKLKTLTPKDAADATTSIAGYWMAFRYAVTPLVMSIMDITKAMEKPTPNFMSVRKRVDRETHFEAGGWTFTSPVQHRVFAKAAVDVDNTYAGLGINPLHTLWDLTPLSFVIDWVLPIGDFLMASLEPKWITETATSYSYKVSEVTIEHPLHGSVRCDLEYYRVKVIGNELEFDFLPRVNMSWKRWVDASALTWFQITRTFR